MDFNQSINHFTKVTNGISLLYFKGKLYVLFPYVTYEGKNFLNQPFFEFGRNVFSDALDSIKLHLIARLMADGFLEKGPIIDYKGLAHLSSKTFFLKNPQYAMEVVLRSVNFLTEKRFKKVSENYEIFEKPNKEEILR